LQHSLAEETSDRDYRTRNCLCKKKQPIRCGKRQKIPSLPEIASQLKKTFPEIEASTAVSHYQIPFVYNDKEGIMADYTEVSPYYSDIFTYEYIEGSKENILKNKVWIYLSVTFVMALRIWRI